jgi:hypothetical protein
MATEKSNEELRRQAKENLAASRAEISAEIQRVKYQLSPRRLLQRVMEDHKAWVVGAASVAGFVAVLLVLRRPKAPRWSEDAVLLQPVKAKRKPDKDSHTMGLVARTVVPAMVNSIIVSPLLDHLHRRRADGKR